MRRWTIAALAGLGVLLLAVPAQAKGEASDVTVMNSGGGGMPVLPGSGGSGGGGSASGGSGGGAAIAILAAPIHLTGRDAAPWMMDTGILTDPGTRPAAKTLGPALDVRVVYACGDQGGTLSQRLFPYAKGGAVAHLLPGQQFCGAPLPATWRLVAPQTMGILHDAGLPASMPAVAKPAAGTAAGGSAAGSNSGAQAGENSGAQAGSNGAASTETSRAAPSNSVPVLPIALGVSAVAAVLALAAVRRRRTVAA